MQLGKENLQFCRTWSIRGYRAADSV